VSLPLNKYKKAAGDFCLDQGVMKEGLVSGQKSNEEPSSLGL